MPNLHQLLSMMVEKGASDLHITAGSPPVLRIDGRLVGLQLPPLSGTETRQLCYSVLTDNQKQTLEEGRELDMSFGVKDLSRFRANLFYQRGAVAGVFRQIPFHVKGFQELGLPSLVEELASRPQGLVLITGPTGSGKSTTLAAIIDRINSTHRKHIITVEDPIEYLHVHKKSLINQREVGGDTQAFHRALRHILRQDPDVVLIGEMRDRETFEAALNISETGHLCLTTLHTNSAIQSINRILDVFPPHHQGQIRAQLSFVLESVISQQLIPRADGNGRALALELMVATPAIRNLIREDKLHQMYSVMQVGQTKYGMQTMNQSLFDLYARRIITLEDALGRSPDPEEFRGMMATGSKG
ncbi:MAG: type IV pilus twitching motility protein PilT [Bradymonadales bacterium]|nr:type IV pilus twitching motility protein PilT [Bradymonadales bacterium]